MSQQTDTDDDMFDVQSIEIDRLRADYRQALDDALAGITRATRHLADLTSPSVFDVEFVDGTAGADSVAFLEEASRSLRAARVHLDKIEAAR